MNRVIVGLIAVGAVDAYVAGLMRETGVEFATAADVYSVECGARPRVGRPKAAAYQDFRRLSRRKRYRCRAGCHAGPLARHSEPPEP